MRFTRRLASSIIWVVWITLICMIVLTCTISRIIRIMLIRIMIALTSRVRTSRNSTSFSHCRKPPLTYYEWTSKKTLAKLTYRECLLTDKDNFPIINRLELATKASAKASCTRTFTGGYLRVSLLSNSPTIKK